MPSPGLIRLARVREHGGAIKRRQGAALQMLLRFAAALHNEITKTYQNYDPGYYCHPVEFHVWGDLPLVDLRA